MKIVISSTGPSVDSTVDPHFGRAPYLLLVDSETGQLLEAIDNSERKNATQGAGIATAALVADKGARYILTGVIGPKAMPVIEKAGITVISNTSGTVQEAVQDFLENYSGTTSSSQNTQKPDDRDTQPRSGNIGSGCRREGGLGKGLGRKQGGGGGMGQGRCRRG